MRANISLRLDARDRVPGGTRTALPVLWALLLASGCSDPAALEPDPSCAGWPDWGTSPYVLPYRVGTSHEVVQGNCTDPRQERFNSHQAAGPWAYAYDFLMSVGTEIVAARAGTVVWVEERWSDGDSGNNSVGIRHDDGTYSGYGHLTRSGALVELGQAVARGEPIARSGRSGGTDTAHLHFQVSPCAEMDTQACRSLPVTFRNTRANPRGLLRGERYEALTTP